MSSSTLTEPAWMAKSKQTTMDTRIEFVANAEFAERVEHQSDRLGMSVGAYIRLAVTERLERDEAAEPPSRKRKSG